MASWAAQVEAELKKLIEAACKALVLEIVKELIKATPVDTGHARSQWVPSIGSPFTAETGDASAQQQGTATVLSFKLGDGVLYVSNNVPYIRRLNEGHSKQAPALFIEAAVDRAMATIQQKFSVDLGRAQYANIVGGQGAENLASAYSPFDE